MRSVALYCLRAVGVFALARYLTRDRLRILCYHGFSLGDEYQSAPVMFMRGTTFERRLQILRKLGIPVISLAEGVTRLANGEIGNAETVITLDDGWASTLSVGQPILERFGYPACVYVTTEHLHGDSEVFNAALFYMIRHSNRTTLTLEGLHPLLDGTYHIASDPDGAARAIIIASEKALPFHARQRLLQPLAALLGFDLQQLLHGGRFQLMGSDELKELARRGMDIQLHTHTHRLPDEFAACAREIELNRDALQQVVGGTRNHLCYPSGKYGAQHLQWLRGLGIVSATTCDPGLNDRNTSPMLLKRFLDGDEVSDIAFEAEVCGARELLRGMRARVRRLLSASAG
ncbi:MAG TPA: polysaccharide deacetylase family protein [Steroidobacteraceae bacterium]|nr:polysaccharide deacetylase family protein [Steroidobacteraceae bacterium]